ncbi:class I SAM-dependent methyltransferase [Gramella sp. GC03-9]|uniref:Class I SAM-dependent methyltransferase n=1 Tax=Christiangramia oceanisediminis TaxID=2920386 RepID=A0A9X2I0C0_9FLAO|nr:class I SAM-dependent methyltransferase [Gramella oceanisediminis]MCP9198320.1 class I SAM-dependent methyltransferase [Gramella oceanisediminis]
MIKKLKSKIKRFVDLRVKLIKDQQRLNQQTILNYQQISQLFNQDSFVPFTAWAISPTTVLHVLNEIVVNNRKVVVEFGAGASTFYIAKVIKVLDLKTKFYAVESNEEWARELQRQLKLYGLENFVEIIVAPLSNVPENYAFKQQHSWYDTKILESRLKDVQEVDLILVDGPPGGSSPYARFSALPYLLNKLASEFVVFLDDVERAYEKEVAKQWHKKLKCNAKFYERYVVLSNREGFDVTPFQLGNLPI